MSESKVCKVQSELEYQYLTEDSKVRVYLSPVRREKQKDSVAEIITVGIIEFFFALSAAYFTAMQTIPYAYQKRGYKAYGGEYILVGIVFLLSYCGIHTFFKYYRRGKAHDKERG